MIKRLFYYFKLKTLLEMNDLIPFVKFILERNFDGISLLRYCIKNRLPHYWMEWLYDGVARGLYRLADTYTFPDSALRSSIIRKFNQARDFWSKHVKR